MSICVIGFGLKNISNRFSVRRKIGLRISLPRLSGPNLEACFKGVESQSKRRQRQPKTIQFFRTWVAPVHPFPVDDVPNIGLRGASAIGLSVTTAPVSFSAGTSRIPPCPERGVLGAP
jgi:hypothetical protein